jgi:hypothetical protein
MATETGSSYRSTRIWDLFGDSGISRLRVCKLNFSMSGNNAHRSYISFAGVTRGLVGVAGVYDDSDAESRPYECTFAKARQRATHAFFQDFQLGGVTE